MLFRFAGDFFGAGCVTGCGRTGCSTPGIGGGVFVIVVGDDDGDDGGGVESAAVAVATTFRGRLAAVFFGANSFVFGSAELSDVATVDFRRVTGTRFFAGLVRGSAGVDSFVGTATGGGANGNSPVMASLVTSSLLVAPDFSGGLVGLAMTEV